MSRDQRKRKTFCETVGANGFIRGETLDIFLGMLDHGENKLDNLFEGEIDNIKREVIFYRYVFIYFIRLLRFCRYLVEYFKSFCLLH